MQELIAWIKDILEKNNPTAMIGLSAFSYHERHPIELPAIAEGDEG